VFDFTTAFRTPSRSLMRMSEIRQSDDTPAQTEADRRAHGPWLWRDLIDEFLTVKLPKPVCAGVSSTAAEISDAAPSSPVWPREASNAAT
jgi:hypothetical protein